MSSDIDLIHALDRHHRDIAKVSKTLKAELPRLRDAVTALERGKPHITDHYVRDSVEALERLADRLGLQL